MEAEADPGFGSAFNQHWQQLCFLSYRIQLFIVLHTSGGYRGETRVAVAPPPPPTGGGGERGAIFFQIKKNIRKRRVL